MDAPLDVASYAPAWRARIRAQRDRRAALAHLARQGARRCAARLASEFGVDRVYLFGSLADPETRRFGERSDVDLATQGLPAERYFDAIATLDDLLPEGLVVDLVRVEDAPATLGRRIVEHGEVLFERT